jgi:hypothetical protein
MKYRIRATYKGEIYEFNLYDHMRWLTLLYKTGGITLNKNTVHLKYVLYFFLYYNPHIVGHEAVHVHQARRMGWKYLPTYAWQTICAGFIKRKIPMEIEAYENENLVKWEIIQ